MTPIRSWSRVKSQAKLCKFNPHQQLIKTWRRLISKMKVTMRVVAEFHFLRRPFRARSPVSIVSSSLLRLSRQEPRSRLFLTLWETSKKCLWVALTLQKFHNLARQLAKVRSLTKIRNPEIALTEVLSLHSQTNLKTVPTWDLKPAPRITCRNQTNKKVEKFTKTHLNSLSR